MKLGELVGLATRNATIEALRWQNGLEASYTRGVFHALGRYGVKEATLFEDIAPFLSEADLDAAEEEREGGLLRAARRRGGACAGDGLRSRAVRHDSRRPSPPMRWSQQAAALAANLAAQVHRWAEFRSTLRPHANGDVKTLVLRALALGWSEKWRTQ